MEDRKPVESFEAVMSSYILALDRYTDEQFLAKPSESEWSLGQMYEHLYVATTFFFLANVNRCLEHRKGQEGGEMSDTGKDLFSQNSFPETKIKIPEALRGPEPEARERSAYRTLFTELVNGSNGLAKPLEQDTGTYKTRHPVFGWLNACQWLQACEMHARHHLRQQKEREEWLAKVTS